MVDIVIAVQDLPRGLKIPEDGVGLQPWPASALPAEVGYFTDTAEVVGQIARTDLVRGAPILQRQVVEDLRDIAQEGSDIAAILPPGLVAVSLPLDLSGVGQVAYGIQDGDYVDVILSFLFIDVDETFNTRLPNTISIITRLETGELSIGAPRQGRQEPSTLSPEGVLVGPSETTQRPRLVTQRTVEGAFVVHVGYFPPGGNFIGSTPTPLELAPPPPAPGDATPQAQATAPLPTATEFAPIIITLGVLPQDALVLTWAVDSQIPITLALRAAGDVGSNPTQSVTLQYMIQNFNIDQPDTLPFAIEPPITSVRRFDIGTLYSFLEQQVSTEGQ
jgi:Flp pilus assembly protein CpaB